MSDYYKVLQVQPDAEIEVIQAAYRRLSRKYHPDTNHSSDAHKKMSLINEAYAVLADPIKRAEYDRQRISDEEANRHEKEDKTDRIAAELALHRLRDEIKILKAKIDEWPDITQNYLAQKTQIKQRTSPRVFVLTIFLLGGFTLRFIWMAFSQPDFLNYAYALGFPGLFFVALIALQSSRSEGIKNLGEIEQNYQEGMEQVAKLQSILDEKTVEYHHCKKLLGAL